MAIEDVLKGEDVKDGSYKTRNVSKLWKLPYKGNIYGINGGRHFFTPNHPFMTVDGWKSLAPAVSMKEIPGLKVTMLKVGDILVKRSGLEVIYSLDSTYVEDYVYNITVDDTHEYFADDYLVHNVAAKDPGVDCVPPP
jgi:intein/homing endonuclease